MADPKATGNARPVRPLSILASRVALWLVVGLGAFGGIVGAVRSPSTRAAAVSVTERRDLPVAAAGFAQVAARQWLEADTSSAELDRLFLNPPDMTGLRRWPAVVRATSVVATHQFAEDYWSVTVAVDFNASSPPGKAVTWFLELGVLTDGHGHFVAAGEPAVLAQPPTASDVRQLAQAALRTPTPDNPVASTVAGFLAALLTGNGQVDRYTTAGVGIEAVTPPPFDQAHLEGIASTTTRRGLEVRVSVRARRTDGDDRLLGYQLLMVKRDGRWEVASMSGAPALAATREHTDSTVGGGTPAPSTSTTAPTATTPGA